MELPLVTPPPRKTEIKRQLLRGGPGDIPIVHTLYDTYALWSQLLLKFPKSQRYTLGETCARHILESLEILLFTSSLPNSTEKINSLRIASGKIDTLKLLIRLVKDCKCVSNTHYLQVESHLHDAGKMLGGWVKSMGG
ncbi:four helix bundle protein [Candidatus Uhrbacteria bacterium]|nr:four helix bundle protein [Candidatus Uhrbacteria bacterium]